MNKHAAYVNEIIEQAQNGDESAVRELVHIFESDLFSFMFAHVQHREDAEDLTQETLAKIYAALGSFRRDLGSIRTWVYTIARRTLWDFLRKKRRRQEILPGDYNFLDWFVPCDHSLARNVEQRLDIAAALVWIHPRYKEALKLFYWEDCTYMGIAERLGLPLNTVKTYMRRGKMALRKQLEPSRLL